MPVRINRPGGFPVEFDVEWRTQNKEQRAEILRQYEEKQPELRNAHEKAEAHRTAREAEQKAEREMWLSARRAEMLAEAQERKERLAREAEEALRKAAEYEILRRAEEQKRRTEEARLRAEREEADRQYAFRVAAERKAHEEKERLLAEQWDALRFDAERLLPGIDFVKTSVRNKSIAFVYEQGMTLDEVARQFGISRERVRQISMKVKADIPHAVRFHEMKADFAVKSRGSIIGRVREITPEWHDDQSGIEWTPQMQAREFRALRAA